LIANLTFHAISCRAFHPPLILLTSSLASYLVGLIIWTYNQAQEKCISGKENWEKLIQKNSEHQDSALDKRRSKKSLSVGEDNWVLQ